MPNHFSLLTGIVWSCALVGVPCRAQTVFKIEDLPSSIGAYYRLYSGTNDLDITSLVGTKGGPQRWDVSRAKGPGDDVDRVDIVAPSDGGHGALFPDAAYAERTTTESSGGQSWNYYRLLSGQGRADYGFYDPASTNAPAKVFAAPAMDLPATVSFNQVWQAEEDFGDVLDLGFTQISVVVHFTAQVLVDAYGTLVLPSIGEVPALRVNELHTYGLVDTTLGFTSTYYIRNYYWLVTGIGQALQVLSFPDPASSPPDAFDSAATVLRAFESSLLTNSSALQAVTNLHAALNGKVLSLSWDSQPAASKYQVQSADSLAGQVMWQALLTTTNRFASDPLETSVRGRFYRVLFSQ